MKAEFSRDENGTVRTSCFILSDLVRVCIRDGCPLVQSSRSRLK